MDLVVVLWTRYRSSVDVSHMMDEVGRTRGAAVSSSLAISFCLFRHIFTSMKRACTPMSVAQLRPAVEVFIEVDRSCGTLV